MQPLCCPTTTVPLLIPPTCKTQLPCRSSLHWWGSQKYRCRRCDVYGRRRHHTSNRQRGRFFSAGSHCGRTCTQRRCHAAARVRHRSTFHRRRRHTAGHGRRWWSTAGCLRHLHRLPTSRCRWDAVLVAILIDLPLDVGVGVAVPVIVELPVAVCVVLAVDVSVTAKHDKVSQSYSNKIAVCIFIGVTAAVAFSVGGTDVSRHPRRFQTHGGPHCRTPGSRRVGVTLALNVTDGIRIDSLALGVAVDIHVVVDVAVELLITVSIGVTRFAGVAVGVILGVDVHMHGWRPAATVIRDSAAHLPPFTKILAFTVIHKIRLPPVNKFLSYSKKFCNVCSHFCMRCTKSTFSYFLITFIGLLLFFFYPSHHRQPLCPFLGESMWWWTLARAFRRCEDHRLSCFSCCVHCSHFLSSLRLTGSPLPSRRTVKLKNISFFYAGRCLADDQRSLRLFCNWINFQKETLAQWATMCDVAGNNSQWIWEEQHMDGLERIIIDRWSAS